jgi:Uma2 family endonuclease
MISRMRGAHPAITCLSFASDLRLKISGSVHVEAVTAQTEVRQRGGRRLDDQRRWAIADACWEDYEDLSALLPPLFRLAFDGSSLEIMVTGQLHDDYADALDTCFKAVAGALGIPFQPYRSASWSRPEIERGIQADNCYYLSKEKIKAGLAGRKKRSNDPKDYPNPDLAIEVDLSPPKIDREGIYTALGVTELWTFNGTTLVISHLDNDRKYRAVEKSCFLPLSGVDVVRWVIEEDRSDYDAWTKRIRTWARKTLKSKGSAPARH